VRTKVAPATTRDNQCFFRKTRPSTQKAIRKHLAHNYSGGHLHDSTVFAIKTQTLAAQLSTTQHTFYELRLKPTTAGTPNDLVANAIRPALLVARRAWILAPAAALYDLLKLTWGFAGFMRSDVSLNVILIATDDRPAADWVAELSKTWQEVSGDAELCERLSLLRGFRAINALKVATARVVPSSKSSPLLNAACERGGLLLLTDSNGTGITIQHVNSQLPTAGESEIELRWSFGDPQRNVARLLAEVRTLESATAAPELATQFVSQIDRATLLPANWVERFKTEDQTTLRLFEHQKTAIDAWEKRNRRGIFQMCTGAGKTIASLAAVRRFEQERRAEKKPLPPVIVTVPTRILADQWVKEIQKLGFTSILKGYNSSSNWLDVLEPWLADPTADQPRFVVSTYRTFSDSRFKQRLVAAAESGARALWIADEMHNLASPRLGATMTEVAKLCSYRLGLSATPEIEGDFATTERLLNYFGLVCASYELKNGIEDGVLCPYRYYPRPSYLSATVGEKYLTLLRQIEDSPGNSSSLLDLYRQSRELVRTSGVQINAFKELLPVLTSGQRPLSHTLVYCPPGYGSYGGDQSDEIDTDESERRLLEEVVAYLRGEGITVSSILGDTPATQRELRLEKFKSGELQVLCAIGCLDEGVDVPAIERAVVLYSVDRLKQFVQRRGRILRIPRGVKNKIAEIYDIVVLPHGSSLPASQAAELLNKEMRRYSEFARLSINREAAQKEIDQALSVATAFQPQ
jgi:superfamily II DNA or RNA helicase